MFSCNYNGWADVPEEEREGIEAFESTHLEVTIPPAVLVVLWPAPPVPRLLERRAA